MPSPPGARASRGAFRWVITVSTPGAASAAAVAIRRILPAATVLCTKTACARFSRPKSAGYRAAPVTLDGPSTRSTPGPDQPGGPGSRCHPGRPATSDKARATVRLPSVSRRSG